jgi:hypothetical protein
MSLFRGNAQAVKKLFGELKTTPRYRSSGVTGLRMNFHLYDIISSQLKRFRECMVKEGSRFPGGGTPSTVGIRKQLLATFIPHISTLFLSSGTLCGGRSGDHRYTMLWMTWRLPVQCVVDDVMSTDTLCDG